MGIRKPSFLCSIGYNIFIKIVFNIYFFTISGSLFSQGSEIGFTPSILSGVNINNPTSLDFGPDGRLYVSQQNGVILAYTINKIAANNYQVTATETILLVKNIPNHNDDGSTNTLEINRQITGILLSGTAQNPVLYVGSSDPRIGGGGTGGDKNLDTNSGIISKLTKSGSTWTKVDLVRGLPRSEENHANNGMQLDEVNNILYVASGGNTNAGAPSNNFAFLTEYALSAAILAIDLNVIDALPTKGSGNNTYKYDIPTLDDPTRTNVSNPDYNASLPGSPQFIDQNDPFGGNDGLNQAKIIPGGPVQIHSPGYRNSYDLVITKTLGKEGRMYTIDNGPNGGWGGHPDNEGAFGNPLTTNVTNNYVVGEPGSTGPGPNDAKVNNLDNLHLVSAPGMAPKYGGHPTPIRANPAGAGLYWYNNSTNTAHFNLNPNSDWPPVPLSMANPVEGDYRNPGVNDGALMTFKASTNGLAEYTATGFFNGALTGDLITASFDGNIYGIKLNTAGDQVVQHQSLASGFGNTPLDVICQGNNEVFTGTIWAVAYASHSIHIFEPNQSQTWQPLASSDNSNPQTRSENAYVEAGGKFYLIGGRGNTDLDIYNPVTNSWSKGTKPPLQFHHFQAVSWNNLIYVIGAFIGDYPSETPVPNIYIYNPGTDSWSQGPSIPENRRRGSAGIVVYNNKIYMICGIQNGHQSGWVPWLDVFDPSTNSWTVLPDAPRARDHFHAVVIENKIYNAAGRRSGSASSVFGGTVAEVDVYNITSQSWATLPATANIPTHRAGNSAVVMEHEILVIGGESTSQTIAHNETEALNVLTNSWRTLSPLNKGRHGTQTVTHNGKYYIVAGTDTRGGGTNLVNHEVFIFNSNCTGNNTSYVLDDDNDGYSNADETDNGTNPCSAASIPPDFNGNFISDLNDPDDDSDGILDENDAFPLDFDNGTTTSLPIDYPFLNGVPGTGLFGLGFTGLMTNGTDNYLDMFDDDHPDLIMGGAVGLASFPAGKGDAITNNQKYAFQFGVNVSSSTHNFTVESQILGEPYFDNIPLNQLSNQTQGIYIGNGDQNNYLKIAVAANNGNPGIQVLYENNGVVVHNTVTTISNILSAGEIHLLFNVDAINGIVQPQYYTNLSPGAKNVGSPINLTGALKNVVQGSQAMAAGLIASSGNADPYLASYNFIKITSPSPSIANPIEDVSLQVNSGNLVLNMSNVFTDDGGVENLTLTVSNISNNALVKSANFSGKTLTLEFHNDIIGSSNITVRATDMSSLYVEDVFSVEVTEVTTIFTRINSGGPLINFNDENWNPDANFSGGTPYKNVTPIAGTENDAIYQTERWGVYQYNIPVPIGTYAIKLHFAEIYYGLKKAGGIGSRVFNVNIENGQAQLQNYDIIAVAGAPGVAIIETFNGISVSDGSLTISVSSVVDNGKISAIEILSSGLTSNHPPVVMNPGNFSFPEGSNVSIAIQATDPDSQDVLTYSTVGLPASLAINPNTGLISGTIEANTGEYNVVVKVTDQKGLSDEETFKITITESGSTPTTVLYLNSGGPNIIYSNQTWTADQYATGGTVYSNNTAIAATLNDKVYQSERWGNFSYQIPLSSGTYNIKLHFAEIYYGVKKSGGPGTRVFNVNIENNQAQLLNYDILAKTGPATAIVESFENINVTDGFLTITLSSVVDNPKINGIEIISEGDSEPPPDNVPPVISTISNKSYFIGESVNFTVQASDPNGDPLTYSATGLPASLQINSSSGTISGNITANEGTYIVTVRATDPGTLFDEESFTINVTENTGNTALAINSGGPALTFNGNSWLADQYASGGTTYKNAVAIAGTENDVIYQTERWGVYSYQIPVPNGTYDLRLHFAEIYYGLKKAGGVGTRVFNVTIENNQAQLQNYDIFAKAGGAAIAVVENFLGINVSDGFLTIELSAIADSPKINALEIIASGSESSSLMLTNNLKLNDPFETGNSIKLYPNPASDKITIETNILEKEDLSLYLIDNLGKIISLGRFEVNSGNQTMEISLNDLNLPTGMYILKIESLQINPRSFKIFKND